MNNKKVLILGASSAIARAIAKELAKGGSDLYLAGRDLDDLTRTAADLNIRFGVNIQTGYFDAINTLTHKLFVEEVINKFGKIDVSIVAFGSMEDQGVIEKDFQAAEEIINSNFVGAASILTHLANYFETCKQGSIIVISSVAGDRGRQSNYVYGSAKGALTLFTQGLRNRLFRFGVNVITVKPGFVDTSMTYGIKLPPIVASPTKVARDICKGLKKRTDIIYTPFFWRYIMLVIRFIPESVFKKLNL